jgi:hypothetical protein
MSRVKRNGSRNELPQVNCSGTNRIYDNAQIMQAFVSSDDTASDEPYDGGESCKRSKT